MRLKFAAPTIIAIIVIASFGAASASAATEVGNKCAANTSGGGNTWVSLANGSGSPIAAAVPAGGVLTRWTFSVGIPLPPGFSTSLKILRGGTGTPKQFQVVADSGQLPINGGTNSFPARIPVQTGDFIGTFGTQNGSPITLICATGNPADRSAVIEGDLALNASKTAAAEVENVQVPLVAFVEPDADNDGFGDETQDLCPTSAAVQAIACPPVALSTSTQVKTNSVTVIATSSTAAPVTVIGVAMLGKGKKAKMNGGTQNLVPGTLSKYRLFFPKGLKNKLKKLPRKRSLKLNVTVTGTSVAGAVTTNTLKLRLKGQAKPKKKSKKRK